MKRTLRPFIPPCALIISKYAASALPIAPKTANAPVYGMILPMRISLSFAPCSRSPPEIPPKDVSATTIANRVRPTTFIWELDTSIVFEACSKQATSSHLMRLAVVAIHRETPHDALAPRSAQCRGSDRIQRRCRARLEETVLNSNFMLSCFRLKLNQHCLRFDPRLSLDDSQLGVIEAGEWHDGLYHELSSAWPRRRPCHGFQLGRGRVGNAA